MLRSSPKAGLVLSNNEMRHAGIELLLKEVLATISTETLNTYPDLVAYRERLAACLGVPVAELLFSAGSDNAYLAVLGVLGAPGVRILTHRPNYSQLFAYADLLHIPVDVVPLSIGGDRASLSELIERVGELSAGDIVTLSNPNGPLGSWWSAAEVLELCRAAARRGVHTLIDEAYGRFAPETLFAADTLPERVIVVQSFSKGYGLAGARFAAIRCVDASVYDLLLRWNVANPVSHLTLELASGLLGREDRIRSLRLELNAGREAIAEAARFRGALTPQSEGNFQVVVLESHEAVASAVQAFAAADVAVRDLARFGVPSAFRVTACVGQHLERVLAVKYGPR